MEGLTDVLGRPRAKPGSVPTSAGGGALRDDAFTLPRRLREDTERSLAFRRLAEQHLDRNYRLAAVILGDPVEAQDATHDAFVTAWQKWHTLRDHDRFDAWFGRILVNTCRDRLRRSQRRQIHDISGRIEVFADDDTAAIADGIVVRRALCRLKPEDRILLALRYYRDMKVDDIAEAMGLRPRTVTSRLHRALERLRRSLAQDETPEWQP